MRVYGFPVCRGGEMQVAELLYVVGKVIFGCAVFYRDTDFGESAYW